MSYINTIRATPYEIWKTYDEDACAYVDDIFTMGAYRWKCDVVYPDVKCIKFCYCDRGISDWGAFRVFLHTVFPNLEVLLLRQNYSYKASREMVEFMCDPWLRYIWIDDMQSEDIHEPVIWTIPEGRMLNSGTFGYCVKYQQYIDEPHVDTTIDACQICINQDISDELDVKKMGIVLWLEQADVTTI